MKALREVNRDRTAPWANRTVSAHGTTKPQPLRQRHSVDRCPKTSSREARWIARIAQRIHRPVQRKRQRTTPQRRWSPVETGSIVALQQLAQGAQWAPKRTVQPEVPPAIPIVSPGGQRLQARSSRLPKQVVVVDKKLCLPAKLSPTGSNESCLTAWSMTARTFCTRSGAGASRIPSSRIRHIPKSSHSSETDRKLLLALLAASGQPTSSTK